MRIFTTLLLLIPVYAMSQTTNLLISEYGEGTPANRKYLEIYNGTGTAVDLSNYQIWKTVNNAAWTTHSTVSLTGTLADGDVFVVAHNSTDVPGADLYDNVNINWNGDDPVGLAWNGGSGTTFNLIDVLGDASGTDPGDGFVVAGVTDATKDKVLTRKASVCSPTTDWSVSAGTDAATSQWEISALAYSQTNEPTVVAGRGSHTADCAACPTIPAPTAPAVSACTGSEATLTATASETGSTLTWYDDATAGAVLGTGTTLETDPLTMTTSFWVEETLPSCPASPRTEVVVTVHALPTVDAGADFTACTGENITLSGSGAVDYTWDNGVDDGEPFAIAATTTYTVTGTDANGCEDTDEITVTVSGTAPVVDAGPDVEICLGETVTLEVTGTDSYSWSDGTNTITNGTDVSPTTTTTYTVTADNGTCQNTDQLVITVYQPSVAGTASASDNSICLGDSVVLSVSGNTGSTIEWFVQPAGIPIFTSFGTGDDFQSPAITVAGTYSLKAEVTNGTCAEATTAVITVVVNSLPIVEAGSAQTVCAGTSVTLSGAGAIDYTWDNGVTNGAGFVPTATATYTVTGTDANGCENTDNVTVTVNPLPTVGAGSDQTVCAGDDVTLTATGNATSVSWNNGVTNGQVFNPTTTVTYTVTGTLNGCTNTDQVVVTVNAAPSATATLGANLTLTATPAGQSYQWINCANNQPISGATSITYTPTANGSYAVEVTNTSGCSTTSSCVNVTSVGLEDKKADAEISLFPNPTKGKITLAMGGSEQVNVVVYNALGQAVTSVADAQNGTVIDLSAQQTGVYMVRVTGAKSSSIHRIVKN